MRTLVGHGEKIEVKKLGSWEVEKKMRAFGPDEMLHIFLEILDGGVEVIGHFY